MEINNMKKVFCLCIFVLIQSCNSTVPKQNLKSNLSLCPKDQNAFKHDCIGDFIYFGGAKYSGEWKNNKRQGKGVYYSSKLIHRSFIFKGNWKNNIRHGRGQFVFEDTDYRFNTKLFSGEWKEGAFINYGTEKLMNGRVNNKADGSWLSKYTMN